MKKTFCLLIVLALGFICKSYASQEEDACYNELKKSLNLFMSKDNLLNAEDFKDISVTYIGKINDEKDIIIYADTLTELTSTVSTSRSEMSENNGVRSGYVEIIPSQLVNWF